MKKILLTALVVGGGVAAYADIDHSQLINMPGAGTGSIAGQNLSMLETGESTFGWGAAATTLILADDFTVTSNVTVTGISVFSYLTSQATPSVTAVSYAIGSAPSLSLTAGAFNNAFMTVGGKNVYRVNAGDTGSTGGLREIQQTNITGLNLNLTPGTYYLSWQVTGTSFSPPLPLSLSAYGQNEQQSTSGGAFAPLVNGNGLGTDMAFIIHTQTVPEPATFALLGLGLLPLVRRRRK